MSEATASEGTGLITVKVKTLQPATHEVQISANSLVSALKERLVEPCGLPVDRQRLIFKGRVLNNDQSLADSGIQNGFTVHLVEGSPEGPPAIGTPPGQGTTGAAGEAVPPALAGVVNSFGRLLQGVLGPQMMPQGGVGGGPAMTSQGVPMDQRQGQQPQPGSTGAPPEVHLLSGIHRFLHHLRQAEADGGRDSWAALVVRDRLPPSQHCFRFLTEAVLEILEEVEIPAHLQEMIAAARSSLQDQSATPAQGISEAGAPGAPGAPGSAGPSAAAPAVYPYVPLVVLALGQLLANTITTVRDTLLPECERSATAISSNVEVNNTNREALQNTLRSLSGSAHAGAALLSDLAAAAAGLAPSLVPETSYAISDLLTSAISSSGTSPTRLLQIRRSGMSPFNMGMPGQGRGAPMAFATPFPGPMGGTAFGGAIVADGVGLDALQQQLAAVMSQFPGAQVMQQTVTVNLDGSNFPREPQGQQQAQQQAQQQGTPNAPPPEGAASEGVPIMMPVMGNIQIDVGGDAFNPADLSQILNQVTSAFSGLPGGAAAGPRVVLDLTPIQAAIAAQLERSQGAPPQPGQAAGSGEAAREMPSVDSILQGLRPVVQDLATALTHQLRPMISQLSTNLAHRVQQQQQQTAQVPSGGQPTGASVGPQNQDAQPPGVHPTQGQEVPQEDSSLSSAVSRAMSSMLQQVLGSVSRNLDQVEMNLREVEQRTGREASFSDMMQQVMGVIANDVRGPQGQTPSSVPPPPPPPPGPTTPAATAPAPQGSGPQPDVAMAVDAVAGATTSVPSEQAMAPPPPKAPGPRGLGLALKPGPAKKLKVSAKAEDGSNKGQGATATTTASSALASGSGDVPHSPASPLGQRGPPPAAVRAPAKDLASSGVSLAPVQERRDRAQSAREGAGGPDMNGLMQMVGSLMGGQGGGQQGQGGAGGMGNLLSMATQLASDPSMQPLMQSVASAIMSGGQGGSGGGLGSLLGGLLGGAPQASSRSGSSVSNGEAAPSWEALSVLPPDLAREWRSTMEADVQEQGRLSSHFERPSDVYLAGTPAKSKSLMDMLASGLQEEESD